MDKHKLVELAERCEAATGPDDALDWAIAEAVRCAPGLAYTASLDVAMTLVPDDYDWLIGRTNGGLTVHAEVGGRGGEFQRFGNTPALALCAAALRSHAQKDIE